MTTTKTQIIIEWIPACSPKDWAYFSTIKAATKQQARDHVAKLGFEYNPQRYLTKDRYQFRAVRVTTTREVL